MTLSAELGTSEREVLDLERAWVNAEIDRDEAALRAILDDQFVCTFGSGRLLDKEAFIRAIIGDGSNSMLSHDLTERTFVLDGDTAVVVDTDTVRGTNKGASYTNVLRATAVYVRREGSWRVLAEHLVRREE
jgi:ketosteroid isomerase-like protein